MEDKNAGHRKRTKEKYSKQGEGAFYDYELLEMLLFYAIPRCDTKGIAKELLGKFGSMDNVVNADIKQLKAVQGIGDEAARLIKLVADISKRALDSREEQVKIVSMKQAGEYFKKLLTNEPKEKFAAMVLDGGNRKQYCGIISEGSLGVVDVPLRELTYLISDKQATAIIIAHNHPKGIAEPSSADIDITLRVRDFMKPLGVTLLDHIIIASGEVYSMRSDLEFNHYFFE